MKKINSIWYGLKVILIGVILFIVVPLLIYLLPFHCKFIDMISVVSFIIGVFVLFVFFIILKIELHQDKRINQYYKRHKNMKRKIDYGKYECQNCGNRAIIEDMTYCPVCGIEFVNCSNKIKT